MGLWRFAQLQLQFLRTPLAVEDIILYDMTKEIYSGDLVVLQSLSASEAANLCLLLLRIYGVVRSTQYVVSGSGMNM
jgi:hypothetical protein